MDKDLLIKAWQTSFVLLSNDRQQACELVSAAVDAWLTYPEKQEKRKYFKLKSRDTRNKIIFDYSMLFQYLLYQTSERFEKKQEQDHLDNKHLLHQQTMITRFIKHLIYISIEYKSFQVTVGLCRVLHNYSSSKTQKIYETLTQSGIYNEIDDPYRDYSKSDDQYRDWKKTIMEKLKDRFNLFVDFCDTARGEKRFKTQDKTDNLIKLVYKCLDLFTPWQSLCVLPKEFNKNWARIPLISQLSFLGINPDDEHPIEKNRMHTLIHSECLSHLIKTLGFAQLQERLEVPKFLLAMNNGDLNNDNNFPPSPDLENLPTPTHEDFAYIWETIAQQQLRRKTFSPTILSIVIDSVEQGCLDLRKALSISLNLKPDANLIQIFAKQEAGDLLLSTLSLRFSKVMEVKQEWISSIKLEGGQKITLKVLPLKVPSSVTAATIEIIYREPDLVSKLLLSLAGLSSQLSAQPLIKLSPYGFGWKPVLTAVMVILLMVVVWLYMQPDKQSFKSPMVVGSGEEIKPMPKKLDSAIDNKPLFEEEQLANNTQPKKYRPPVVKNTAPTPLVFRNGDERVVAKSLLEIKTIYLEAGLDHPLNQDICTMLINRLQASNKFILTDKEQADGVFKIFVNNVYTAKSDDKQQSKEVTTFTPKISLKVLLINVKGEVLWPQSNRQTYLGSIDEVTNQVVEGLLDEIRKLENGH